MIELMNEAASDYFRPQTFILMRSLCQYLYPNTKNTLFSSINHNVVFKRFIKFSRNMRIENEASKIIIHPNEGKHGATMLIMHGLGDSGDGWLDAAQMVAQKLPHVKVILPTASQIPVTLNGGMRMNAWYDITGLSIDRAAESCDGIEASVNTITDIIRSEVSLGITPHRILLAGFSQGGAMSIFCGLQLPIDLKPAGLIVMSGYLPGANKFKMTEGFDDVPILHCHGKADPVVQYAWGEKTRNFLVEKGVKSYQFKSYNGVGHTVTNEILNDVTHFIETVLPDDRQFYIKPKAPDQMSIKELKLAVRNAGLSAQVIGFTEKSDYVKLLNDYYSKL